MTQNKNKNGPVYGKQCTRLLWCLMWAIILFRLECVKIKSCHLLPVICYEYGFHWVRKITQSTDLDIGKKCPFFVYIYCNTYCSWSEFPVRSSTIEYCTLLTIPRLLAQFLTLSPVDTFHCVCFAFFSIFSWQMRLSTNSPLLWLVISCLMLSQ